MFIWSFSADVTKQYISHPYKKETDCNMSLTKGYSTICLPALRGEDTQRYASLPKEKKKRDVITDEVNKLKKKRYRHCSCHFPTRILFLKLEKYIEVTFQFYQGHIVDWTS